MSINEMSINEMSINKYKIEMIYNSIIIIINP